MNELTKKEKEYYKRQLPLIGEKKQKKLKKQTALIGGIGGIGTAAAQTLTRLGVGKLKIIDKDQVETSNLNRQILYTEKDIGKPKTKVAKQKLQEINSNTEIEAYQEKITQKNIKKHLKNTEAFIDGLDNMKTRYIVNKECIKQNKPYFHASCQGYEARITTIIPHQTPCLQCIYRGKKPKKQKNISTIGYLPNKLGIIQTEQYLKYINNQKGVLKNQILIYSQNQTQPSTLKIQKNPNCPICQK